MKTLQRIVLSNDEFYVEATLEYNYNEEILQFGLLTEFDGVMAEMKLGFEDKQEAIDVYETFSEEQALDFRALMEELFADKKENQSKT